MKLSVIVPVLNESTLIVDTLSALQPLRGAGHEVIVVDGGSSDGTPLLAEPYADKVIAAPLGRARQMNWGAWCAQGDVLVFLHADSFLPAGAERLIASGMEGTGRCWGRFDVALSGGQPLLRVVEFMMNLRSRLTGIATGDQGIFVRREVFHAVGGFSEIDLMEDVALCKKLKRYGPPLCLSRRVVTSSRRWERNGILRTVALMWWLRLAYFLGDDPRRLARLYAMQKQR